ncbi:uncharacterized protein EI90DRAFT_603144 [Cantharellus anzutake]|uniref:uncharacterized protein n=1 Tax=Cantharellus anzutake TaxID=1750568 RepID=UPI001905EA29|nr:uncharacterized protein EI90DRAFT_603144 [Cantharellus anzutake]KAF8313163.1 hypothetical protein EI90DRAFT_603144 [Cantharellus anzutake]
MKMGCCHPGFVAWYYSLAYPSSGMSLNDFPSTPAEDPRLVSHISLGCSSRVIILILMVCGVILTHRPRET